VNPAVGGGIICGLALLGAARIILVTWRAVRKVAVAAAKAMIASEDSAKTSSVPVAPQVDLDALAAKLAAILGKKSPSKKDETAPTSEKVN
jgi:hypothetical protein